MLAPWAAVRSPWRLYRAFHYHRIALLSTVKTFSPTSRRQQYFSATHKAGITDGAESLNSDELDRSKESINQISNLITQGEYQLANRLRLKLSQQGIRLPTNPIYAQAVRLALLQPNYVEDCPSFIAWLRACPDASHSGHKPFLDIRHILFSRPMENVHLIHQFGLVCASKGYIQLVNEDILPVIARLPESMNREGMCNEIAEEVRKYGVGSHHNSMTSTPRAGPMSSKSRHVPSGTDPVDVSLFSVIEDALPSILPEPPSPDLEGDSVFEDDSHPDYESSSHAPMTPQIAMFDRLAQFIEAGQYNDAKRILSDIKDLGGPIPPSFVYEKAAQFVLGFPLPNDQGRLDLDYEHRLEDFTFWFSLIPPFYATTSPDPTPHDDSFTLTRKLLFGSVVTQLSLILRFGLICAEKGYADSVSSAVISVVMRYAPPEVSLTFLREYEARSAEYLRENMPGRKVMLKKSNTFIRGLGIRGLASAGHLEAALSLIPDTKEAELKLTPHTYDFLLHRLIRTGRREYSDAIENLRMLRGANAMVDRDTDNISNQAYVADILSSFKGEARPADESLAETLRYIRSALRSQTDLPHPLTIMNFIDAYMLLGRWRALGLLRSVAFRSGYQAASAYINAEMLYNYRRGFHSHVIQGFVDNFYLTGVPRDEIVQVLGRVNAKLEVASVNDDGSAVQLRDANPAYNKWGKIFPNPIHCSIVWHSLVAMTPSKYRLEDLYRKLLAFANGQTADQLPSVLPTYSGVSPLIPPPLWINTVSPASFTPFMRRLMKATGASRGARILGEMLKAGLKPTVYHFTELAGFYAHEGDVTKAMHILDRMEAKLASEKQELVEESASEGPTAPSTPSTGDFDVPRNEGSESLPAVETDVLESALDELIPSSQSSVEWDGQNRLQLEQNDQSFLSTGDPPGVATSGASETRDEVSHPTANSLDETADATGLEGSSNDTPPISTTPANESTETQPPLTTTPESPPSEVQAASDGSSPQQTQPRPAFSAIPSPDYVMYVSLMRGFIISRSFDAVAEVNRRMLLRYQYTPGADIHLDAVYEDWETLASRERKISPGRRSQWG